MNASVCHLPDGQKWSLINWPGRHVGHCSFSHLWYGAQQKHFGCDLQSLSQYSFYLLVSMVAINNLQNTQPPLPKSYLSGCFKAIFQHEATHAKNQGEPLSETNRRPHREAAGDLQPDRPGSVKATTRRCFTASHLSHLAPLLCGPFADTPLFPA